MIKQLIEKGGDTIEKHCVSPWNCNDQRMKRSTLYKKKFIAFTLTLVLVLACITSALAANNQLSAASHGGYAQSGTVKKIRTGNPSVTVNSITNLDDGLCFYFRVRYADGTRATYHYKLKQTGVRTIRYMNDDIRNDLDASFFIRIQTYDEQTRTVTVNISWAP